jgi:ubiquinone/menaquinone biosynthesis C-methylase UbiE
MPAWGYIPGSSAIKNFFGQIIGYPHPLGRIAAGIVRRFADFSSDHTLDIGCDAGIYTIEFLRRGVRKVTAVDINEETLTLARKNLASLNLSAELLVADAQALPFPDNTFDQVLCLMVMEHVKDPVSLLQGISRVLKPGGRLILSVPNELYLTRPVIPYDFSKILQVIGHEHKGYYLEDLEKIFSSSKLMITGHRYYYKFFSRVITEILYLMLGVKKRPQARERMITSSWSSMLIFALIYPILFLDHLDFSRRGGCMVVKAVNKPDEQ